MISNSFLVSFSACARFQSSRHPSGSSSSIRKSPDGEIIARKGISLEDISAVPRWPGAPGWKPLTSGLLGNGCKWLRKNFEIGDWGFERARLPAAPQTVFNDLWHGWEAVPLQNSDAQSFSATSSVVPQVVKEPWLQPLRFALFLLCQSRAEQSRSRSERFCGVEGPRVRLRYDELRGISTNTRTDKASGAPPFPRSLRKGGSARKPIPHVALGSRSGR
jgi:hypothetical protein